MTKLGKEFDDAHETTRASLDRPLNFRGVSAEIRMKHMRKWTKEFREYCHKKERNSTWLDDVEFLLEEIDRLEERLK